MCSIIGAFWSLIFVGENATSKITVVEIFVGIILVGIKTFSFYKMLRYKKEYWFNYRIVMLFLLDIFGLILLFITVSNIAVIISGLILGLWLIVSLIHTAIFYKTFSSKGFQEKCEDAVLKINQQQDMDKL